MLRKMYENKQRLQGVTNNNSTVPPPNSSTSVNDGVFSTTKVTRRPAVEVVDKVKETLIAPDIIPVEYLTLSDNHVIRISLKKLTRDNYNCNNSNNSNNSMENNNIVGSDILTSVSLSNNGLDCNDHTEEYSDVDPEESVPMNENPIVIPLNDPAVSHTDGVMLNTSSCTQAIFGNVFITSFQDLVINHFSIPKATVDDVKLLEDHSLLLPSIYEPLEDELLVDYDGIQFDIPIPLHIKCILNELQPNDTNKTLETLLNTPIQHVDFICEMNNFLEMNITHQITKNIRVLIWEQIQLYKWYRSSWKRCRFYNFY